MADILIVIKFLGKNMYEFRKLKIDMAFHGAFNISYFITMLHPKRTCIIRIKNFSHSMPQSHFKIQFDIKLEKNKLNSTSTFKGGYSNFLYLTELIDI